MNAMDDFLWYSYFGITPKDAVSNRENAKMICAQRAYLDLCRTLKYFKNTDESKNDPDYQTLKETFIECIKKHICHQINRLFKDKEDFDTWHKTVCDGIVESAQRCEDKKGGQLFKNKEKGTGRAFYYGQAQKWLNMTLKYMLLMGLWNDDIQVIEDGEKPLHVPVDDYIMDAAACKGKKIKSLLTDRVRKNESPWSRWSYDTYIEFQVQIRGKAGDYKTPMGWEQKAWVEIAEYRKEQEKKRQEMRTYKKG